MISALILLAVGRGIITAYVPPIPSLLPLMKSICAQCRSLHHVPAGEHWLLSSLPLLGFDPSPRLRSLRPRFGMSP